jgi:hypothetical protein
MALGKTLAAEKDLMSQIAPDARTTDPLAHEIGIARLRMDALLSHTAPKRSSRAVRSASS